MAGPTTARRGEEHTSGSGPPGSPPERPRLRRPRLSVPSRRVLVPLLAAGVLLVSFAVWVLHGSSWLRVERVTASGTVVLTSGEVRAAAGVPLGDPLISVDTDTIEARLLKELPRIDSVEVVRSWPHGIALKVTERKPELLIKRGQNFIEVDAKGVRFATVPTAPKGVPLLEMETSESPSLRRFGTGRLEREAVRVAADLPGNVVPQTRTLQVRSYDSIALELTGGRTVDWGSSENGRAKARVLLALLKAAPEARHFDVSAPTAPAVSGS